MPSSSYVSPDYVNTYKNHVLVRLPSSKNLDAFQLVEPGSGWMQSTVITFYGPRPEYRQIAVTGDLCPGTHGVLSNWGYGLEWFAKPLSERYLCEKFLREVWVPEKCRKWLERELAEVGEQEQDDLDEFEKRHRNIKAILDDWEGLLEEEGQTGIYHRLYDDLGQWAVDDGMPGMDYDPHEAGRLCAAQQAFARLYPSLPPENSEPMVTITKAAYRELMARPPAVPGASVSSSSSTIQ